MGITISSKRHSCDMGYGGFARLRNKIAEKISEAFHAHYLSLSAPAVLSLYGEESEKYFKKYDATTNEFMEQGVVTIEVANFLYQSDCDGKIDRKQAKQLYELIKDCDENMVFGYFGRADCATMGDIKNIFSDGTKVEWK